jgi:hypothetical protein
MYYADRFQLDEDDYVIGVSGISQETQRKDLDIFTADLDKMRGNSRVWFLFSNVAVTGLGVKQAGGVDEELFLVYYLDTIGTRLDYFREKNAAVYLYDLSEPDAASARSIEQ